ncbi:MAG: hypothetical protein OXU20_25175 [Myxococcales bacterium]|nr:hypothetical protein [Myxococcales bacterium]MDD9972243.1 hypothetical protein [Myxococcales bacterium]
MFVQAVAIGTLPPHAQVGGEAISLVLRRMDGDGHTLQQELDRGFRDMELRQPHLSEFLAEELSCTSDPAVQTLSFFLLVVIYRAFCEAFGNRLGAVGRAEITLLARRLIADGELRNSGHLGDSYSEDIIALGQPALVHLMRNELERVVPAAEEVAPGWREAEPLYEALLLEILALSHAVDP